MGSGYTRLHSMHFTEVFIAIAIVVSYMHARSIYKVSKCVRFQGGAATGNNYS